VTRSIMAVEVGGPTRSGVTVAEIRIFNPIFRHGRYTPESRHSLAPQYLSLRAINRHRGEHVIPIAMISGRYLYGIPRRHV
jgi:hypothetical protein